MLFRHSIFIFFFMSKNLIRLFFNSLIFVYFFSSLIFTQFETTCGLPYINSGTQAALKPKDNKMSPV